MKEETARNGFMAFALKLMQNTAQAGKNVLVSPYSVIQALSMAAEGAAGETRSEILSAIGVRETADCRMYHSAQQSEHIKLLTANSAWVRQNYPIRDDYIRALSESGLGDVFQVPFDSSTVEQVNQWINEKTDHMIPVIAEHFSDETAFCLVNAIRFHANWAAPYGRHKLHDDIFIAADGSKQAVTMMVDEYGHTYLSDEYAEGFIVEYEGENYSFAALLPKEGMTTEEYLAKLTPERMYKTLSESVRTDAEVIKGLPEFKYDFGVALNETLKKIGISRAFMMKGADFSGITDDPAGLYLSNVLHKTFIEVTPFGTSAGAGTLEEWAVAACAQILEPKRIILNRPFVYLIFDRQTKLPMFIGTVNSITD